MTTTSHAVTGAMIATVIRQPFLVIPLAFLSHFVCDALPHFGLDMKFGEKKMYWWLGIDGTAALLCATFLLWYGVRDPVLLAICGFAAMSPDLAWLYYGLKGPQLKIAKHDIVTRFHSWIQWYQKVPGIFIDFAWVSLMLTIIIKLQ